MTTLQLDRDRSLALRNGRRRRLVRFAVSTWLGSDDGCSARGTALRLALPCLRPSTYFSGSGRCTSTASSYLGYTC